MQTNEDLDYPNYAIMAIDNFIIINNMHTNEDFLNYVLDRIIGIAACCAPSGHHCNVDLER